MTIILMVIDEYSIGGYILLVVIDGYFINGYYWLLYYKLLSVIICYITTIGDYCIINYCWILYVIISLAIGSYYIVWYFFFKL
jgi:hypothetical protein